ncbi:MAG: HAMP domain-containing protein [bacterium]|nr:MAG: HAMP domain-containing protein [bacterium]
MRLGLMSKFSIISAVVLLFTMTVFTFFNISTLKRAFMEVYTHDVDQLSETILRSTYDAMLRGDVNSAYQLMDQAGAQENIKNIRLIDKSGVVQYSRNKGEIHTVIDKNTDKSCSMCHQGSDAEVAAPTMDRSRVFTDAEREEVLGVTTGIYNEEACYQAPCHYHPGDVKLLGVLEVVMSLRGIMAQVNTYVYNVLVELVFLILALAICLNLLIRRLIISPVNTLLDHTKLISRGDWQFIKDAPPDEIGELADAFNEMTETLKNAREERERWAATLESRVEERTRQIRQMQSVLVRSEKLASLGELAAGIAHELNNPLTGILIHASFMEKYAELSEELGKDLATITAEADRCARIVKNLLDFSRKTEPRKAMNDLNETIDRALGLVEHLALFHNVEIVKEYAANLPELLLDAGQMEQVFVNMFVNAGQAMEGSGKLIIWTGLDVDGESVVIRVQDTGKGIKKEHIGKVFDPFFSTKGASGTGLGLSVSYGIVEQHGGTIEVYSEEGKGATFIVTLAV